MQITVKGKSYDVTDAMREYAQSRVRKIIRHFDGVISTDVTLTTERNWRVVEITVYASGFILRAEDRTNDMYASIDLVIDKLAKQLKKQKGKWEKRMRSQKQVEMGLFLTQTPRGERDADEQELIMNNPMVVRVPMMSQKPMTIEEAIKEMEALNFSFFVFLNDRTETINIIYPRKGGFGLVDPTFEREV